ncbi:MAG: beta-galactosidase [Alphaproteobacteria bacterium]|nr:beta-galactosidase [Alphaproteobacteria bacterium]
MTAPEFQRRLGVCYYPEHWPEEGWAEDARRMVELGLTWVRIGEFAWSRLEPAPGDYAFGWLDRAVAVLGEAGLKVVLGTPTATPPRWLLDRHPDMLAVGADGQPRGFGSRRHYCFSHEGYRDESARITAALAERCGENDAVAAWQTDNEYGCHDTVLSYSDAALAAFRLWLLRKYETIEALNAAWGNVFWSMEYTAFDQIGAPVGTVTEPNPAHVLDYARFSSDQVADFNRIQADIIRAASPGRTILHNYMGRVLDFDHFKTGADLDAASWDSYPLGFLEDRLEMAEARRLRLLRQGDPDFQAFHHDLYRAVGKGRSWVMEQQPGPVNWAGHNPAPLPGMVRLWTWEAFAHGAEVVSYFRWRQAPFAQEQMHTGLLRPDSVPAQGYAEARQVAEEVARLHNQGAGDVGLRRNPVALIFDYESAWAWGAQPQGAGFDYFDLVFAFYRALRRLGVGVDFIPPTVADLSTYKVAFAPGLFAWTVSLRQVLADFKGVFFAGPRSGSKTKDFITPTAMPPDLPDRFPGLVVSRVESIRPGAEIALEDGGVLQLWCELLDVPEEFSVDEATAEGDPVLVRRGQSYYLAGWPEQDALARMVSATLTRAAVKTEPVTGDLRLTEDVTYRYIFNYGPEPADASPLIGAREIVLGTPNMQPADVVIARR